MTTLSFAGRGVSVGTVLPLADGELLVAGATDPTGVFDSRWLVGRLTGRGRLDPQFGRRGWDVLPWHGDADSLAVTNDGHILVGGSDRPRANGWSMVSELTHTGAIVTGFGKYGRAQLPDYHDGGLDGLWVAPDGGILTQIGGGNMGCWGLTAITLTPTGRRVPGFTHRFQRAFDRVAPSECGTPVFDGGITPTATGFQVIGTSQHSCVYDGCTEHPTSTPDPTRRLRDIAFTDTGHLDASFGSHGQTARTEPMAQGAWVLPQRHGRTLLVATPLGTIRQETSRSLVIYALSRNGHLDTRYADRGIKRLQLPRDLNNNRAPLAIGAPALPVSNGRTLSLVINTRSGDAITVQRLRP